MSIYTLILVSTVLIRDGYNPDKFYDVNNYSVVEKRLTKDDCESLGNKLTFALRETKTDESKLYHVCVKVAR